MKESQVCRVEGAEGSNDKRIQEYGVTCRLKISASSWYVTTFSFLVKSKTMFRVFDYHLYIFDASYFAGCIYENDVGPLITVPTSNMELLY